MLAARALATVTCLLIAVAGPATVVGVAASTAALLVVVGAKIAGVRARSRDADAQSSVTA